MQDKYDYLVIGSGPAGYVSAIKAAQLGLKVAVVEKDPGMLGGVCLNEGCIPAKSLYHSARVFNIIKKESELYGLEALSSCANIAGFVEKSRQAAKELTNGITFLFKKNDIDLIEGRAQFVNKETVQVSAKPHQALDIKAGKFLIAAGSFPQALAGVPFDGKRVIASSHAIRLTEAPKKMLIVGGGAIGTEFASFFNIIGTDVSIIEIEDSLLPAEDKAVSARLKSIFKKKGINVFTSSFVKDVLVESDKAKVTFKREADQWSEEYDVVLVSIGRVPATGAIGLETAGVETDNKGFIPVDANMRTNVENIYAAGDVVRSPMLAHMAYAEGELAAESAKGLSPDPIDYDSVPNVVYTEPQVASVGASEEKAKSKGFDFAVGKHFFKANGKAVVDEETDGFIKVIAEESTRKLLGAHIIGYEASELIHEFVLAKRAGLTIDAILKTIHAHPTLSETAPDACRSVFGKSIHG